MSNTPLTDAIVFELDGHEFCDAERARDLERDRAALLVALRMLLDYLEIGGCSKAHVMETASKVIAAVRENE